MGHAKEQPHNEHSAEIVYLHEVRKQRRYDGAEDPFELSDAEILDAFLSEANHPTNMTLDTRLIAALDRLLNDSSLEDTNVLQDEWRTRTKQLQVDVLDLDNDEYDNFMNNDPLAKVIYGILGKTERGDGHRVRRIALRELLNLRAGMVQQPDLDTEENQARFAKIVDKLDPTIGK